MKSLAGDVIEPGRRVWLGCTTAFNDDKQHLLPDDREQVEGDLTTEVAVPAGTSLGEAFTAITAPVTGVWDRQSPDLVPTWVASDDDALAGLLASHWSVEVRPVPTEDGP